MSRVLCKPCNLSGEKEGADWVSVATNDPYCEPCWMGAPYSVRAMGGVRLGVKGEAAPVKAIPENGKAVLSKGNQTREIKAGQLLNLQAEEGKWMKNGHSRKRIEIDEGRLRELHAKGMNDREISKALGCSAPTVCVRRGKLGLAPNGGGKNRAGPPARAVVASQGKDFRAKRVGRPKRETKPNGKSNGSAEAALASVAADTVTVPVALLDGIWNRLNPQVKAELLAKLD